jgi:aryl-alcohol dehydrogenase-like predicted oxidoreductase
MDHLRFGRTDLTVSQLCLGTMSMGSSAWKRWVLDEPESIPILKRALDLGINFFDMADWYSLGRNEEVVGRNLLRMTARQNLVLASKVFYPMSGDPKDRGLSREHIAASIDRSLARIGTDHLDLYVIHAFDPETPIGETMEALDATVRAGKVRYLGASTMYAWQFARMNQVAAMNGWTPFVNMQCQYNLIYRDQSRQMFPNCRQQPNAAIG